MKYEMIDYYFGLIACFIASVYSQSDGNGWEDANGNKWFCNLPDGASYVGDTSFNANMAVNFNILGLASTGSFGNVDCCAADTFVEPTSRNCQCNTNLYPAFDSSGSTSCVSCDVAIASASSDMLRNGNDCDCKTNSAIYKATDSSSFSCACITGFTKAAEFDSDGAVTSHSCMDCSSVTQTGLYVSGFNCATQFDEPICGSNAYPDATTNICKCVAGYAENSSGTCVSCATIMTAEGVDDAFSGGASQSKLLEPSSTSTSCSCVADAIVSAENVCECLSNAIISSDYFNTGGDQKACKMRKDLTGVVIDKSTDTAYCGLNAYVDEAGSCSCLTVSNSVSGSVSVDYSASTTNDFCYPTHYNEKCVQDNTSETKGLIYNSCSAAGFEVTLNEECRLATFGFVANDKWFVGDTADSGCQLVNDGSNRKLSFLFTACGVVQSGSTYTATIKFDSTGLDYTIGDVTVECETTGYTITGNAWSTIPVEFSNVDFEFTDVSSLATLTFGESTTTLGATRSIAISALSTAFTFRINTVWVTTDATKQPFDDIPVGYHSLKIMEDGCSLYPCWSEISENGNKFEFRAFAFSEVALPSDLYVAATVLTCDKDEANECAKTSCPICVQSGPSRRRRNVWRSKKVQFEVQDVFENNQKHLSRHIIKR